MKQTIWEVIAGIIYRKENNYYSHTFVGFLYTSAAPQRPVLGTAPFQVATPKKLTKLAMGRGGTRLEPIAAVLQSGMLLLSHHTS